MLGFLMKGDAPGLIATALLRAQAKLAEKSRQGAEAPIALDVSDASSPDVSVVRERES